MINLDVWFLTGSNSFLSPSKLLKSIVLLLAPISLDFFGLYQQTQVVIATY